MGQRLAQRYRVGGFPGFVVVDDGGNVLSDFAGYRSPEGLIAQLRSIHGSGRGLMRR